MVDGDDLVISRDKLGVDGTNDGLLHDLGPLLAAQLDLLLVDGLAVGLADLKHEGPVGACLLLGILHILAITLHQSKCKIRHRLLDLIRILDQRLNSLDAGAVASTMSTEMKSTLALAAMLTALQECYSVDCCCCDLTTGAQDN